MTLLGVYMPKGSAVHLVRERGTETLCGKAVTINPAYVTQAHVARTAGEPENRRRLTEASRVTCLRCALDATRITPHACVTDPEVHPPGEPEEPRDQCAHCGLVRAAYVHEAPR